MNKFNIILFTTKLTSLLDFCTPEHVCYISYTHLLQIYKYMLLILVINIFYN